MHRLAVKLAALFVLVASVSFALTNGVASAFSPGLGPAGQTLADSVGAASDAGLAALSDALLPATLLGLGLSSDTGSYATWAGQIGECRGSINGNQGYPNWFASDFTGAGPLAGTGYATYSPTSGIYCDPLEIFPELYPDGATIASEPWVGRFCATMQVYDGNGWWAPSSSGTLPGTSWSWLTNSIAAGIGGGYGAVHGPGWTTAQNALDWINAACPPAWLTYVYGVNYTAAVAGTTYVPLGSGVGTVPGQTVSIPSGFGTIIGSIGGCEFDVVPANVTTGTDIGYGFYCSDWGSSWNQVLNIDVITGIPNNPGGSSQVVDQEGGCTGNQSAPRAPGAQYNTGTTGVGGCSATPTLGTSAWGGKWVVSSYGASRTGNTVYQAAIILRLNNTGTAVAYYLPIQGIGTTGFVPTSDLRPATSTPAQSPAPAPLAPATPTPTITAPTGTVAPPVTVTPATTPATISPVTITPGTLTPGTAPSPGGGAAQVSDQGDTNSILSSLANGFSAVVSATGTGLTSVLGVLVSGFNGLTNVITAVGNVIVGGLNQIVTGVNWLGNVLLNQLKSLDVDIGTYITWLEGQLGPLIQSVASAVLSLAPDLGDILNGVTAGAASIVSALSGISLDPSGIISALGDVVTAVEAIPSTIVTAVEAVGTAVATVTSAVEAVATDVTSLPAEIATDVGLGLETLFEPSTTTITSTETEMSSVFPLDWAPPVVDGAGTVISGVTGGLANGACGPHVGWTGAAPVPSYGIYLPTPSTSGCPGNGPAGARTSYDNSGGDLFGYRVIARDAVMAFMFLAFAVRVIRSGPWNPQADDLAPNVQQ